MNQKPEPAQYSEQEMEDRLSRMLKGAFAGPPTPLKDIPKKNGRRRKAKRKRAAKAR